MDRREVDFVVTDRRQPVLFVECQLADREVDRGLRYLKKRFPEAEAVQIALAGVHDHLAPDGVRVMPALRFLRTLL